MKKFVIATTIAALLTGTAMTPAMADHRDNRHGNRYEQTHNNRFDNHRFDNRRFDDRRHHWKRGERVSRHYMDRNYLVRDYRAHRLNTPPRGYHWVQADNDYLLVAAATGLIAAIIASSR